MARPPPVDLTNVGVQNTQGPTVTDIPSQVQRAVQRAVAALHIQHAPTTASREAGWRLFVPMASFCLLTKTALLGCPHAQSPLVEFHQQDGYIALSFLFLVQVFAAVGECLIHLTPVAVFQWGSV